MDYKNITVAGCGMLGSQIAFHTAFHGFEVSVYDIDDDAIEKAKARVSKLAEVYLEEVTEDSTKIDDALNRIHFYNDLAEAVKDADLLIEAIPEINDTKVEFYKILAPLAPEKTIFATNSSTMIPSQFREFTGRPEKFLALHFANLIWLNNTAEVMGHDGTDQQYEEDLINFARSIGMIPLHIKKEQPGYILNSLLIPFLNAGQALFAYDIAEPHTIDKTWMIATNATMGPFAILDIIGLKTAYNIFSAEAHSNPTAKKIADLLKDDYIDHGKLGVETGEGFYKYPNPAYKSPDFMK